VNKNSKRRAALIRKAVKDKMRKEGGEYLMVQSFIIAVASEHVKDERKHRDGTTSYRCFGV
jgi:hypothetical protein